MAKVTLDALISREDFEVKENSNPGKKKETISIEDIKADSFFFSNIRKPDFQRETNEWDSQKICELIKSFIEGDLIPAIILWRSTSGYLFVIDGSHRLSSLSAWINNDYGDGKISKLFYDGIIPDEQLKIAQTTRNLVDKIVGSYEDFKLALTYPDKVKSEIVQYARNLGALAIQLQWVEGDASKAESSFFKINQKAVPIDKTELKLLKSRNKPNSIAARAIIRSGKGHKYWSSFSKETQNQIQEIAEDINKILFEPKLQIPIKTLDVPVAGKLYSAQTLQLILEFVNIANDVDFSNKKLNDETTGEETIQFLKRTRKIAQKLNSNHSSSLGLHPIVYFYSRNGRYRTVSFWAIVDLIIEIDNKNKFKEFIKVRETFETFILDHNDWIKQIYEKHRDNQKSYKHISNFSYKIIVSLNAGNTLDEAINAIVSTDEFSYLVIRNANQHINSSKKDFNTNQKSEVFIKEAMPKAPRCKICNGLIHKNSMSTDHIQRKEDGGLATLENGQITHPYCNTGYKN
jgi:Protein of unknown function DUF262/HNH endonuclease